MFWLSTSDFDFWLLTSELDLDCDKNICVVVASIIFPCVQIYSAEGHGEGCYSPPGLQGNNLHRLLGHMLWQPLIETLLENNHLQHKPNPLTYYDEVFEQNSFLMMNNLT